MVMATYREIQYYVEATYGFIAHPSWIAEVKEIHHIPLVRNQSKRIVEKRVNRCPKQKIAYIEEALKHFKII
jgi:23S rRNA (uracil1939-C5)-methyltransferase